MWWNICKSLLLPLLKNVSDVLLVSRASGQCRRAWSVVTRGGCSPSRARVSVKRQHLSSAKKHVVHTHVRCVALGSVYIRFSWSIYVYLLARCVSSCFMTGSFTHFECLHLVLKLFFQSFNASLYLRKKYQVAVPPQAKLPSGCVALWCAFTPGASYLH